MTRNFTIFAMSLALALFATPAIAQKGNGNGPYFKKGAKGQCLQEGGKWHRGRGRRGRGMADGRMFSRLNLTVEQQAQVDALRTEMQADMDEIHKGMDAIRTQLHAAWSTPNPDRATIESLHAKLEPYRQQIRDRRTQFKLDVIELLTPEQRENLAAFKKERGKRMGPRKGFRKNKNGMKNKSGYNNWN